MLEMASSGAKVLQTRSVAMAMRHNVNLQVRSSFNDTKGKLVVSEDSVVEQETISGIAYSPNEAKITIIGLPDKPGIAAGVFGALADQQVNVDMIVQSASSAAKKTDISFSVGHDDLQKAVDIINKLKAKLEFESLMRHQMSPRFQLSVRRCALSRGWPKQCLRLWLLRGEYASDFNL